MSSDTAETGSADAATGKDRTKPIAVRLVPAEGSDQPVLANYTTLHAAPGMVMLDFGFLEPAVMSALPRVAKRGGKLPESVNGRLAVRVAMGYEAAAGLHQQLSRLLADVAKVLDAQRTAAAKKN